MDIYCLEGHSSDNTYAELERFKHLIAPTGNLILNKDIGDSVEVCSVENKARFAAMSRIGNLALSKVDLTKPYTHLLWVESDLILEHTVIDMLIQRSNTLGRPSIVAPITKIKDKYSTRTMFYDTWGFRNLDGSRWTNYVFPKSGQHLMSSIGSCALIDMSLIRNGLNFGDGCFVELCKRATDIGATIMADCDISVYHPSNAFVKGRWV
jgi:hypothetical protein